MYFQIVYFQVKEVREVWCKKNERSVFELNFGNFNVNCA